MGCLQSSSSSSKTEAAAVGATRSMEEINNDRKKSMGTSLTTSVRQLRDRMESLDQNDDRVVAKKEKLLEKQKKEIVKNAAMLDKLHDWELVFDDMSKAENKTEFSSSDLNRLFIKMGIRINITMLNLLFNLFDANNNGTVDKTEFVTAAFFLTQRSTAHDTVDLAFRLFDSNLSGGISKSEFAEMAISLMVKASFLLAVPSLRKAFRAHLQAEACSELLDFFEAVETTRISADGGRRRSSLLSENGMLIQTEGKISVKDLTQIATEYIEVNAPRQVNLSENNRETILNDIKDATNVNGFISSKSIDRAIQEVITLLETDAMPRFQRKVRDHKIPFVDEIWKEQKIAANKQMNKKQFREWAKSNPGVFSFLEDLQRVLHKAEVKQKIVSATRIQRAFRRYRTSIIAKSRKALTAAKSPHQHQHKVAVTFVDESTSSSSNSNNNNSGTATTNEPPPVDNISPTRRLSVKVEPIINNDVSSNELVITTEESTNNNEGGDS
jgi:Ca2+-binding EF-hand superfamily protein